MEKEFVPYKLALELKELGFDMKCFGRYFFRADIHKVGEEELELCGQGVSKFELPEHTILAPLYQQVFDWFRRVYDYEYRIVKAGETYFYEIDNTKPFFERLEGELLDMQSGWIYKTYEEARLECLKKLIEIVK